MGWETPADPPNKPGVEADLCAKSEGVCVEVEPPNPVEPAEELGALDDVPPRENPAGPEFWAEFPPKENGAELDESMFLLSVHSGHRCLIDLLTRLLQSPSFCYYVLPSYTFSRSTIFQPQHYFRRASLPGDHREARISRFCVETRLDYLASSCG